MKTYFGFVENSNLLTEVIISVQFEQSDVINIHCEKVFKVNKKEYEDHVWFSTEREAIERQIYLLNFRSKEYEKRAERLSDLLELMNKADSFKQ